MFKSVKPITVFLATTSMLAISLLANCTSTKSTDSEPLTLPPISTNEILWDSWGVPHIYAKDQKQAFYMMGWAQAKTHGNLIAELYGQARGRSAEYWGPDYVENDAFIHMAQIPQRAQTAYDAQDENYKKYITAFAEGLTEYLTQHPDTLESQNTQVLPITAIDVMSHMQRTLSVGFLLYDEQENISAFIEHGNKANEILKPSDSPTRKMHGSNAYAIAPKKSASGNALLTINPHLDWANEEIFVESQISFDGQQIYGAGMVGQPIISLGFTNTFGWTHTVNQIDGVDLYALTLTETGYMLDGVSVPFEKMDEVTIKIKIGEDEYIDQPLPILETKHGPVIYIDPDRGDALAMRMVGLDRHLAIQQYWDLIPTQNLDQFEKVMSRTQIPFFNTVYANNDGEIFYLYNGVIADRKFGTYKDWLRIQPGDRSDYIWEGELGYDALPKLKNPTSGFIHNTNDVPWSSTYPNELKASDYTPLLPQPFMDFRAQNSVNMIRADDSITFDELVDIKQSNRMEMAARIVDELTSYALQHEDPLVVDAAKLLQNWNYNSSADSNAVVLFKTWDNEMDTPMHDLFETQWSAKAPLTTPHTLKNPDRAVKALQQAAQKLQKQYGTIAIPYGDVYRMKRGQFDVPASVASTYYGTYSAGSFRKEKTGNQYNIKGGDTFIAVVEFGDKVRAQGLLPYGNTTQENSPHLGDQLDLFSKRQLRNLWTTKQDVEAHLEIRETFGD